MHLYFGILLYGFDCLFELTSCFSFTHCGCNAVLTLWSADFNFATAFKHKAVSMRKLTIRRMAIASENFSFFMRCSFTFIALMRLLLRRVIAL